MNRLNKHLALAVVLVGVVAGCDRKPSAQSAASSFGIASNSPPQSRCASGSMADADNANCKRQGDANFNKFIGKGGGS